METQNNFEILTSLRGVWGATPWDYSSSRWLRFKAQENSDCCYGYGQTIYAVVNFQFKLEPNGIMKIEYLESPSIGSRFEGFQPTSINSKKDIQYNLKKEDFEGWTNITGRKFKYHWILELDKSPFPDDLKFPYDTPLIYYGHRDCQEI